MNDDEAAKLRETARAAQASAIEAVRMARHANWRTTGTRYMSIAALLISAVALLIAVFL